MKKLFSILLIACLAIVACKEKEDEEAKVIAVSSVSLDKTELTMTEGDKEMLTATVLPELAFMKSVKWSSSDESVAMVSKGEVTACKEGTAVITVTTDDGGKTASCTVKVEARIIYTTRVSFDKKNIEVMVGDTESLSFDFYPEGSTHETPFTWSSNHEIAGYGDGGLVTGYAVGTATIFLKVKAGTETLTDECVVKVIPKVYPVESVSLDKSSITMYVGDTETLKATIQPGNATNKNLLWATSDNRIASIENDGTIKGLMAGSVVISATTEDGGKKATCEVEVKGYDSYVDLGLSVNWASCNLGAEMPESFGDYYAWGELETYYVDGDAQKGKNEVRMKEGKSAGYDWPSYKYTCGENKWHGGTYTAFNKYVLERDDMICGKDGFYDNKQRLDPGDDVARLKSLNGGRMPTKAEVQELIDGCWWNWTELRGVTGYRISSKVDGSKWIFLPAAGIRYGLYFESAGYSGNYWTSDIYTKETPASSYGAELYIYKNYPEIYGGDRANGNTIRPVHDK